MTVPNRHIAHFDLDSFFVSVELLKRPELKGKPVAVGGSSGRGVVASCSYEARKFGVRSAMPVSQAKKLCPELITVKGNGESYSHYSRLVTEIIKEEAPLFEKSSIDEFYIDMSGLDKFFGCAIFTKELRRRIERETGLSISYGLSSNKLISKIATGEAKPHGELQIPTGCEKAFLAPLDIEKIPMIGAKTAGILRSMGIHTVSTLSEVPVETLIGALGKWGMELHRRANGIDDTPIIPYHEAKSIGTENTFHTDTNDRVFLHRQLARMTESIAFELRSTNKLTGCVTVKLRYSDFQTITRQAVIPYMASDHALLNKARELFDQAYDGSRNLRLIGVRFSHLIPGNFQISLFDDTQEQISLYRAMDSVKMQFGEGIVVRGCAQTAEREVNRAKMEKQLRQFK